MFCIGLFILGNMKISSFLKPHCMLHHLVLAEYTEYITKFVQIMPLGPKIARLQGHMFYNSLYRENMKNFLSETARPIEH